jgi:hypothetical protein
MNIPDTDWAWPWWTVMVIINIANLAACAYFYRQSLNSADGQSVYMKRMRIMGLVFTLVALYRAIFVSRYLYQYAWFDTIANSSLLIRTFAWGAELSFSGLFALAMLRFNADVTLANGRYGRFASSYAAKAPYVLMACIFIAQFFATAGLITKSRLSFAIEETLWSLGFLSILPLAAMQFQRMFFSDHGASSKNLSMLKTFSVVNLGWCLIYCTYGLVYHLPTEYWASAFQQLETGIPEIKTGLSAVKDAFSIVNVSHNYNDWGFGFVLWHSAYFSVCVWLAIFLMRAPRKSVG